MMNITLEEEKKLNPTPAITYIKRIYKKSKYLCTDGHELAMTYQRMTSSSSIKRIREYFFCPICLKIYTSKGKKVNE